MHRFAFAFAFAFALAACGTEEAEPIEESPALGACRIGCDTGGGGSGTWTEDGFEAASTCCGCRRLFVKAEAEVCFGPIANDVADQCPDCNDISPEN